MRQALLEIYVATVLETPYDDFDNRYSSYSESSASVTKSGEGASNEHLAACSLEQAVYGGSVGAREIAVFVSHPR